MAKIKVFGGWSYFRGQHGQRWFVVATTSQKKAAEAVGCTLGHLRNFCCETGNGEDIAQAMIEPGVVFHRDIDDHLRENWVRLDPETH